MRREVQEYFMSINIPLMELYGMSESSGCHTLNLLQLDECRVGSCGKPIRGVQLKIVDPDENGEGEVSWGDPSHGKWFLRDMLRAFMWKCIWVVYKQQGCTCM